MQRLAHGRFEIDGELLKCGLAQRLDLLPAGRQRLLRGHIEQDTVPDRGAIGQPASGRLAAQPDDAAIGGLVAQLGAPVPELVGLFVLVRRRTALPVLRQNS